MGRHGIVGASLLTHGKARLRAAIAGLTALAMVLAMAVVGASSASAALPVGIVTAEFTGVGSQVTEDAELNFKVQYGGDGVESLAGQSVTFTFGGDVIAVPGTIDVPTGNEAIDSITGNPGAGTITITFKSPWPDDLTEGEFDLKFVVKQVSGNQSKTLTVSVDGDETQLITIIVLDEDAPKTPTTNKLAKGVADSSPSLSSYISCADTCSSDSDLTISNGITSATINYTVTIDTFGALRSGYTIDDALPAHLDYVTGSFNATLITWDGTPPLVTSTERGPIAVSGVTISGSHGAKKFSIAAADLPDGIFPDGSASHDLPAYSRLILTYQAQVPDATEVGHLQSDLSAGKGTPGTGGLDYTLGLTNAADLKVGGVSQLSDTATLNLKYHVAGVGADGAFGKSSDWTTYYLKDSEVAGGLDHLSIPITYTLTANLAQWNATTDYRTLTEDVVLTDVLPAWAEWETGAGFISASGISDMTSLDAVNDHCATEADFAASSAPGNYCVNGRTLRINVGRSAATNATIAVKARITDLGASSVVTEGSWNNPVGATAYKLMNPVTLWFETTFDNSGKSWSKSRDVHVVDRTAGTDKSFHDTNVFDKSTTSVIKITKGSSATVPYTFTVDLAPSGVENPGENFPAGMWKPENLSIQDTVDASVFDLSTYTISDSSYTPVGATKIDLVKDDYTVTIDAVTGDVALSLNNTGKAKVAGKALGKWTVTLKLTTHPIVGKQTLQITNHAGLWGNETQELYWDEVTSQITTYGNEAEVRKTVWDEGTNTWVRTLKLDESSTQDEFVYRIDFIPHGTYKPDHIVGVTDRLRAGVEFVEFVSCTDRSSGGTGLTDSGGVKIEYLDEGSSGPAIKLGPGTANFDGAAHSACFTVKVNDGLQSNVPLINMAGPATATIVKTNDYPIFVTKADSTDDPADLATEPTAITDPNARFVLKNGAGDVVVDNIFVCDNALVVGTDCATATAVTVKAPGTYYLSELIPPITADTSYLKSDDVLTIVVREGEVPAQQTFYNDPVTAPSVSVGNYVWFDANKDGLHNADEDSSGNPAEPGIPGVVLRIKKVDANDDKTDVTGVNGVVVGPQTTDTTGHYLFKGLPVLGADAHYEVCIDQAASAAALSKYTPTLNETGDDRQLDSSTDCAQTIEALTANGDRDLSLDFGFVLRPVPPAAAKTYAVGDYTWIDVNKNGVQDAGEPVLPGVTVELLNATGGVVATTTTNAQGRYLFDELEAGTYQIRFTLTPAQAKTYSFTKADQGSDAKDSDANTATGLTATFLLDDSNTALTKAYATQTVKASEGIDPTWDAGVIAASVSVGDYVWYDTNGNGRQDAGEPGIEGVTMCLVGPDGKSVIDVFGNLVKPVQTDRDGKYTFDNLPVLSNGGTYTVCIDKDASKHALENYVPTKDGVGDRVKDSSTWTASTQKGDLTKDGQRDATLDFGFIRIEVQGEDVKTYAVGDYVWIDTTYNAVQDRGEPVLAGVTVELLDAKGKVLATTKTDAHGFYLFDGLSAGKYQIRFRLTDDQAAKYGFVMANRGSNDAIDSDGVVQGSGSVAITAIFRLDDSNTALTTTYFRAIAASEGIDPTWDAGVASIDVLGEQELAPLPTDTEDIAYTGVPAWTLLTTALLLLAAGGALVLGTRRRHGRHHGA